MDSWWNGVDYLISIQKLAILGVRYLKDEDFQKERKIPSDIFDINIRVLQNVRN